MNDATSNQADGSARDDSSTPRRSGTRGGGGRASTGSRRRTQQRKADNSSGSGGGDDTATLIAREDRGGDGTATLHARDSGADDETTTLVARDNGADDETTMLVDKQARPEEAEDIDPSDVTDEIPVQADDDSSSTAADGATSDEDGATGDEDDVSSGAADGGAAGSLDLDGNSGGQTPAAPLARQAVDLPAFDPAVLEADDADDGLVGGGERSARDELFASDDLSADEEPTDSDVDEKHDEQLDAQEEAFEGLTPLHESDLVGLDPSALEDDLDTDRPLEPAPRLTHAGPASASTASDLTSSSVLLAGARAPESGWRRFIHQLTGGAVSPSASRTEQARAEQVRAMRTLVTHPRRITVLSRKGGVGKTTTTLMLGQTLASERGDRIIAVDGNPDAGNLGYRIDPNGPQATVTDLLSESDTINRYADMRRYTTQTAVGLEVLRSDDDPQISTALGDLEYTEVLHLLDRFYNLILIDTGTGILDSAVQGILDGTDQIVLVVSPSLDAARSASQTLDWLTEHGFVGLVENAVAVINQTRRSTMVNLNEIEAHFFDRCGATVRIPWDSYLEAGAETELSDLRPATRAAYRQLAAAVAQRFSD